MKVSDLIEKLKEYPLDAVVECTTSTCCGCHSDEVESDTIRYDKDTNTINIDS